MPQEAGRDRRRAVHEVDAGDDEQSARYPCGSLIASTMFAEVPTHTNMALLTDPWVGRALRHARLLWKETHKW